MIRTITVNIFQQAKSFCHEANRNSFNMYDHGNFPFSTMFERQLYQR